MSRRRSGELESLAWCLASTERPGGGAWAASSCGQDGWQLPVRCCLHPCTLFICLLLPPQQGGTQRPDGTSPTSKAALIA
jgi:hypothetical protein